MLKRSVVFLLTLVVGCLWASAARWTLVDFGSSLASTTTPYPGWTTVLRHPTRTQFVRPDSHPAHDGITIVSGLRQSQQAYFGIRGNAPIDFRRGHMIICTFYNRTGDSPYPTVRISFTDANEPNPSDASRPWYTAYNPDIHINTSWAEPYSLFEMRYYIQDESMLAAINGIASTGRHSLINVNIAEFDSGENPFVLTKIELSDEADLTPPTRPANLRAGMVSLTTGASRNVVRLRWNASTDPAPHSTGVSRYYIYRNGELYDFVSPEMTAHLGANLQYLDLCTAPGSTYVYRVAAIDKAQYGLYPQLGRPPRHPANRSSLSAPVTVVTPAWSSSTLLNPWTDFAYAGGFRLPATANGDWSWASAGLAWRPDGNPGRNAATELPGSLYALSRTQTGVGAFTIPKPVRSSRLSDWPRARTLIPVRNNWPRIYGGNTVPSGGADWAVASLAYHSGGNGVGPRLYYGLCNFYGTESDAPSHGWFDLGLNAGHGAWHIGRRPPANINPSLTARYACAIPQAWADRYARGRSLLIGNNYLSGGPEIRNGPNLYAIAPWASGSLPGNGAAIPATRLLQYSPIGDMTRQVPNWRIDRNAEGAAWIEQGGKSALAISYRRPMGDGWYGDESGNNFTFYDIPAPPSRGEGAGATQFRNELMLYNPADLAAVAAGTKAPWEPQPYLTYDLSPFSFVTNQPYPESGAICFATNGYLFFIEQNGEVSPSIGENGLVHAWRLASRPVLSAAPRQRTLRSVGGTTTFRVANTGAKRMRYRTRTTSSWFRITGGGTGTNRGTLRISVQANPSIHPRTGSIRVAAPGAAGSPRWVKIVQAGEARVDLSIRRLRILRPRNAALRRFNFCKFQIVNRGAALRSETVGVHFYLSRDRFFGNADDRKIGVTKFVGLSIPARSTRTLRMGSSRRLQMVRRWTPTLTGRGYYYLFTRVSPISARETQSRDNRTRTSSRFPYASAFRSAKQAAVDVDVPAGGGGNAGSVFRPAAWARSGVQGWAPAPELVDGDTNTVWRGRAGESSWAAAVDFMESLSLENAGLLGEGLPRANIGLLGTEDLLKWVDLESITHWPIPCRALFFDIQDDGSGEPPVLREILWDEEGL